MPVDLTNIYGGYLQSSTYNPVDKRLLQRALKPYSKVGINFKSAAGKSDSELRRIAAQAVIRKHRKAMKAMNK